MSNNKFEYQQLSNKTISCSYCGNAVRGKIVENVNHKTKEREKLIKWNCGRCGNVSRIGRV